MKPSNLVAVNYDNPVPDVPYNTAVRETFLVSGKPHTHHAHSLHSPNCKQGQFQIDAGGASILYGTPQEINSAQGLGPGYDNDLDFDSQMLSGVPLSGTANCGPISTSSYLYKNGHPATNCGALPQYARARTSCEGDYYKGSIPPSNYATQWRNYGNLGEQIAVNRSASLPGMLGDPYDRIRGTLQNVNTVYDARYRDNVRPQQSRREGFHGEWGRGLYDSGLAGNHFVTTQRITKICSCGKRNCADHATNHFPFDEVRTEYTIKGNRAGVCEEPAGFFGDGYSGRYGYAPTGRKYESHHHPYDAGAHLSRAEYIADYEIGPNVASGPVVAQHLDGPLRDKNSIWYSPPPSMRVQLYGSMSENDLMHNAFATRQLEDSNPVIAAMYKYPPQTVKETNISIFDNFI